MNKDSTISVLKYKFFFLKLDKMMRRGFMQWNRGEALFILKDRQDIENYKIPANIICWQNVHGHCIWLILSKKKVFDLYSWHPGHRVRTKFQIDTGTELEKITTGVITSPSQWCDSVHLLILISEEIYIFYEEWGSLTPAPYFGKV
jgi:hypothetical protein